MLGANNTDENANGNCCDAGCEEGGAVEHGDDFRAWDNLIRSEIHAKHADQAHDLTLALPVGVKGLFRYNLGGSRRALISSAEFAAAQVLTCPEAQIDWTVHREVIYDVLHAAYEDFKLSTLTWICLQPLGMLLYALCQKDHDTTFARHYARDFGLALEVAQCGRA